MATFGKYEAVSELHAGDRGAVFSARPAGGGREIKYAVKTFNPRSLDPDEQFWETQSFQERARVQQRVADAGAQHWAPVYDIGTSPAGTYYVTGFHPLSAESLVTGRVDVSAGVLYAIVHSVVEGLRELKQVAGRPHGNLKATNVLISGRGEVAVAGAALTDPASAADAARFGEAGDLYALGELIHLLVLGRRFDPRRGWPIGPSRAWARLGGRQGKRWRRLCNDLLDPDPTVRAGGIDPVARRLRGLVPRRARASRRLSLALATVVVVIAAGAAAVLGMRDAAARKQVCAAKKQWAGALSTAIADPARRKVFESDPDLRRVIKDLDEAALPTFDCDGAGGRFSFSPNLRQFRRTQDALDAVKRAERGLSPIQWRQLARAAELQGRFEARSWTRAAEHLAKRIAEARPGSPDVATGITRLIVALAAVDRDLPTVEAEWRQLQSRTKQLDEIRDNRLLQAFAVLLRRAGAEAISLSDSGFGGLDALRDAAARAERLAKSYEYAAGLGADFDMARLKDDMKDIDLARVQPAHIDLWLNSIPQYVVKRQEIREAAAALRKLAKEKIDEVIDSKLDPFQDQEFQARQKRVDWDITQFANAQFIPRDFEDKTFAQRRASLEADVRSLGGFIRTVDVNEWLKKEPELESKSPNLNAYWKSWKEAVSARAARGALPPDKVNEVKTQTHRLRDVLKAYDAAIPTPPTRLAFADAAARKREQVIEKLLSAGGTMKLTETPEPAKAAAEAVKSAAAGYGQWVEDLAELAKDFPLRQEVLLPDNRPDEKWAKVRPKFWNDPLVQNIEVVAKDRQRIEQLRLLETKGRPQILEVAQSAPKAEVALHAWRLLGTDRMQPPWPSRPGELAAEAELRKRLLSLLAEVKSAEEKTALGKELLAEESRRWRRFAEAAGADEAMLTSAAELREEFGATADELAKLPAAVRFNLSLVEVRRRVHDGTDEGLDKVVEQLVAAAGELKEGDVGAELQNRLRRLQEQEAFADQKPQDVFELKPLPDVTVRFRRVKAPGQRPFYLGETEVSVAQFSAIVESAAAWQGLRSLLWSPRPGELGDPRRGPRSWEWVLKPAPRIYPPTLWLAPDDANNYPKEFRDPRAGKFNATVLSDALGGNPSERHPVQYLSPEAAMYAAALCGCRLPTPGEWREAYDASEKDVPAAKWNLRDHTWQVQREHLATARSDSKALVPAGDDACIPSQPPLSTDALEKSHPHDDGTLYFRPVDGPGGNTFRQLVGNVAEFVCDAPEGFARAAVKRDADVIKRFGTDSAGSVLVIGGSALSPPDLPNDRPLPARPGMGYSDVGFRLAFTAPSRNLAEKLEWALEGQGFVQPQGGTAKREASTAAEDRG